MSELANDIERPKPQGPQAKPESLTAEDKAIEAKAPVSCTNPIEVMQSPGGQNQSAAERFRTECFGTQQQSDLISKTFAAAGDKAPYTVPQDQVYPRSLQLFEKIDADKSGDMSATEIAQSMQDNSIKGQDAQLLVALFDASRPGRQSNYDTNITRTELQRMSENMQSVPLAREILKDFEIVDQLDASADGSINKSTIELIKARTSRSEMKEGTDAMLKSFDEIKATNQETIFGLFDKDGLSKEDLTKYYGDIPELQGLKSSSLQQIGMNTNLYGIFDNPALSIRPEAVRQGEAGDCYLMSAISEVARTDPKSIQDMIKDNNDGTYTVTFPGAKDEPFTVKAPTEAEMIKYNRPGGLGSWANVLEKAYGQYREKHPHSYDTQKGGDTPQAIAGRGGWFEAIEVLTGKSYQKTTVLDSAFADQLNRNLNEQNSAVLAAVLKGNAYGLPAPHMYSVVGFDPNQANGGTVTLRNPWGLEANTKPGILVPGQRAPKIGGTFTMSYSDFAKTFAAAGTEQNT